MTERVQEPSRDRRTSAYFGAPVWAMGLFAVAALLIVIVGFRYTAPILLGACVIGLVAARSMPNPPRTGNPWVVLGPLAVWTAIAASGVGDGAFSARGNVGGLIVFVLLTLLIQAAAPSQPERRTT